MGPRSPSLVWDSARLVEILGGILVLTQVGGQLGGHRQRPLAAFRSVDAHHDCPTGPHREHAHERWGAATRSRAKRVNRDASAATSSPGHAARASANRR